MQSSLLRAAVKWRLPVSPSRPVIWVSAMTALAGAAYGGALSAHGLNATALATVAAVGVAALLSSIAGFAFSAICGAILFQFRTDTIAVVQIMLLCSIANQAMSTWLLRREIRLDALTPFLIGGGLGVPTGVWLLLHLDTGVYLRALGAVLRAYGTVKLARPAARLRFSSGAADATFGFIGGVLGGFAATPGAPVSIWCSMKGWDKVRQRAVFQPFILVMQVVALVAIAALRGPHATGDGLPTVAFACLPVGLAGTWLGLTLFRRLTDRQFAVSVNLLLIASGLSLAL